MCTPDTGHLKYRVAAPLPLIQVVRASIGAKEVSYALYRHQYS
jgi:hypothetical protein